MRIAIASWLSFLLCYWICLSIHISQVSGRCLVHQKSLLLQLKNNLSFSETSSSKLASWDQIPSCCDWSGVSCDGQGHVTGLDLSGESISGGFDSSSSIFSLHNLQMLNLASNNFNSEIPVEFYMLKNLTYLNMSHAGFVGQIPIEISHLTRLVTLDMSSPPSFLTGLEPLKLENPDLRMLIQNLTNIRQLYLDGVTISAQGQEWCNALLSLPSLQELSMSDCNLSGPIDSSLSKLKNLSVLRLDYNYLSTTVPEFVGNFSKLTRLQLSSCGLSGSFPQNIFQIMTLTFIDISYNSDLRGSLSVFPSNGSLQTLVLSYTKFSGELPDSISNLKNLSILDLSSSQFIGIIPNSISKLTDLTYLDLSVNNFTGPIPSFGAAKKLIHINLSYNILSGVISSSGHIEGLQNLVSINLRNNSFNGSIPSSLLTLPVLQSIQLSNNKFSQLDEFSNVSSSILNTLDLSSNNLAGPIPVSIFRLRRLSVLRLSSNKFSGTMLLDMINGLRNLTVLDLSYNNLSIHLNVSDFRLSSFPNMTDIHLASCKLETFPDFLRHQSMLINLDLSDNEIRGTIPDWIWKFENLAYLNLSHNLLTDLERPLQNISSKLVLIDLNSNQLRGPIPFFPKYAAYLDYSANNFSSVIPEDLDDFLFSTTFLSLSHNSLYGSIPDSICRLLNLEVLDLSYNNFSSTIPPCLLAMNETLGVLTLRKNNLTGHIPDNFSSLCALRTLDLSDNQLGGPMPKSLANCRTLEVLDLGKNHIIDGFPCSLKNISTLRVLVLRQNKFHGSIGCSNSSDIWQMLQIIDLAFNNFRGKLPRNSFRTWEGMVPDEAQTLQFEILEYDHIYYQDIVTVSSKRLQLKLVKILTVFTAIDFSSNHLEGPIPEEMMKFKALYILNLSNNALTGQIPSSIGNMRKLESLDLSNNFLSGEIPTQIASLSFLSSLDLSYNHLLGRIPTGTQIQSFNESSFLGNEGLCGPPLTQNCSFDKGLGNGGLGMSQPESSIDWNLISSELGLVFGIGIVLLPLVFWKPWRIWYWEHVDDMLYQIFPQLHFVYESRGGKNYRTLKWKPC